MSRWTKGVFGFFLLFQAVQSQAQETVVTKKDWDLTRAYADVLKILSEPNNCTSFYGGSVVATTVLNDFFTRVQAKPLSREVSFQMVGSLRLMRDNATGVRYRVFDKVVVNTDGSFYKRRLLAMDKFPPDIGSFGPGTRRARALIILHELGHLIEGGDGEWLLADDGLNGAQSRANTLRVQQACYAQLKTLN